MLIAGTLADGMVFISGVLSLCCEIIMAAFCFNLDIYNIGGCLSWRTR